MTLKTLVAHALAPLLFAGVALDAKADDAMSYEGIVRPSRTVTLKAPVEEVLGELTVKQADVVESGELLASMASEVQQVTVAWAAHIAADPTPVEIARLRLQDAELRHQRLKQAFESDAANELEVLAAEIAVDQAGAEFQAAERQQETAQLRLDLEQSRLDRHAIVAPFSGVVAELLTEAGASLTTNDPVIELIALDPLEASFDLPNVTYGRLAVGAAVTLKAGPPVDGTLSGVVDRIVPRIDPGSRTYRVVVRIDNPGQSLPSGFVVWLTLDGVESEAPGESATQRSAANPSR